MTRYLKILGAAVCCLQLLSFFYFSLARGDQNDHRLNGLFADLKHPAAASEGAAITQQIWEVWHQAPDEDTQTIFNSGVALMAQSDYHSSLVAFTRVTKMAPDFAEAWNRRATLLYLMGAFDLSIVDIGKTLALEPRHFGAISGLGQIYLRRDNLSLARQAFQRALDINPHLEGARINIQTIDRMLTEKAI